MMYARTDNSTLGSLSSVGQSKMNLDSSPLKSGRHRALEQLRSGDSLSQSVVKEDPTLSLDKTRMSNSNLLLDNLSPTNPEDKTHPYSTRVQRDHQFFVTNEFLDLNYLNSIRTPQNALLTNKKNLNK